MKLRTCVTPEGRFRYGVHDPSYRVRNLRPHSRIISLGELAGGRVVENARNYPAGDVEVERAARVYEIPNAFPFRGTTYINSTWADRCAGKPETIFLPAPESVSMTEFFKKNRPAGREGLEALFSDLPRPVLLALAATSTDPDDLVRLAGLCCRLVFDPASGEPAGMEFRENDQGQSTPVVEDHDLFETLVNNPSLPDRYKEVMVLRPGVQGSSEIVGEWRGRGGHVYEYLRRNSYIPWGHHASNMAEDAVRYRVADLSREDFTGLRHLYYQRIYTRLASELGLPEPVPCRTMSPEELERMRQAVMVVLSEGGSVHFNAAIWGWNYGYDFAPGGWRLHASHQQIHQQFAMAPATVAAGEGDAEMPAYACGDLVAEFCAAYRAETGHGFFDDYLAAIRNNRRVDGRQTHEDSLVVYEDDRVMLFVPKAQTSQWELNLLCIRPVSNILEADAEMRAALDRGILIALRVLDALGARLVTSIEFGGRFGDTDSDQRLLYSFLPKLPQSPGAFSEAEYRYINGHFPEDFAAACRKKLR